MTNWQNWLKMLHMLLALPRILFCNQWGFQFPPSVLCHRLQQTLQVLTAPDTKLQVNNCSALDGVNAVQLQAETKETASLLDIPVVSRLIPFLAVAPVSKQTNHMFLSFTSMCVS